MIPYSAKYKREANGAISYTIKGNAFVDHTLLRDNMSFSPNSFNITAGTKEKTYVIAGLPGTWQMYSYFYTSPSPDATAGRLDVRYNDETKTIVARTENNCTSTQTVSVVLVKALY